tara:strand:+ start:531 stop:1448 length:918 start_codon:yes stop_codon:yes gene_type:complete
MQLNPFARGGMSLNGLSDSDLKVLASQTGVSFELLKSQQRAEMATSGSQGQGMEETVIPTVEIKLVTNPKNPKKARKKNIKMLRKALRPPNYNLGLFKVYRYNAAHECACCGVDVRRFLEGDNAYNHIIDDRTGLSLADIYWFDEDTKQARKPHARTHGDHGDEMNSTLCPAHLHIYHTLRSMVEEHNLAEDGFSKITSKGTRFMRVPGFSANTAKNRSTPESLMKYSQFFDMVQKDAQHSKGVTLTQHPNPITGVADLVTITFDLRALQIEQASQQQQAIGIVPQQMMQMMQQQAQEQMVAAQQ